MKKTITGLLLSLTMGLYAQKEMTLQDCINHAFENNLNLKNAYLDEQLGRYDLQNNKAKLLPSLSSSIGNNHAWGRSVNPNTNSFTTNKIISLNGSLSGNLTLFEGGFNRIKRIKSAKYALEINRSDIQRIKNDLTIDVASKYINILYLKANIEANKSQLAATNQQLKIAEVNFKNGTVIENDVIKIKAQRASEQLTLTNTENSLFTAVLELKQLMQYPLEQAFHLKSYDEKVATSQWMNEDIYALVAKAMNLHPNYQKGNLQTLRSQNEIKISRGGFYPSLSMSSSLSSRFVDNQMDSFSQQLNANLSYGINFSLSIPIFNRMENRFNVKRAKARYEKAKLNFEIAKNKISETVLRAIGTAKAAKTKYENALEAYGFQEKSYQIDLIKYKNGSIDINSLNLTKNQYNNAQSNLIRSKYEWMYNNAVVKFYLGVAFAF